MQAQLSSVSTSDLTPSFHRDLTDISTPPRYHAQLAFLSTKFPSDVSVTTMSYGHISVLVEADKLTASRLTLFQISLPFSYHLPFPPPFSLSPDAPISLPSLTFERASVLYNVAALYASMAAAERRAEAEGIKRALGFLTVSPSLGGMTSFDPGLNGRPQQASSITSSSPSFPSSRPKCRPSQLLATT